MHVSIVIPAYNAASTLDECLDACLQQSHADTEIIVVDDGSSDDTPSIAQAHSVRYIRQKNSGPAAARNLGAREAGGEIVAFTDSDCVPDPDWIERLLAGFSEGVVGVGGTYDIRNDSSLLARLIHEEIVVRHERFRGEVDFLGSFNVAYRKGAFDAVSGFDESFTYASAEDNDLAYRLQDEGGSLRFVHDARVAHYHPTRLLPYLRTQMRHGFWRMKLYAKHPRRGTGDHYAGLGELLGPPLSLLLVAGIIALPLLHNAAFSIGLVFFAAAYGTLTASIERALAHRLGARRGIIFRGVTILRDIARGLGLVGGVWTFFVLKRETA